MSETAEFMDCSRGAVLSSEHRGKITPREEHSSRSKSLCKSPRGPISHAVSGAHLLQLPHRPRSNVLPLEQKIRFQKIRPRHRPKGTGTHSRPTRGLAEDFSQMAIVNLISGGRPTSHRKTGVSSRNTPGPHETLKESGVPDR
ncbi:hypothetical protein CDAR_205541 [Caerostris darwini]|uniref:Uncharacterized protein n=1 Tax=Caerostris darwini TaxID=1538125 RepID=A0AAV4WS13_9ARAC|nr:hypothetical protein CDAR_205541 [Caerostris darwini]